MHSTLPSKAKHRCCNKTAFQHVPMSVQVERVWDAAVGSAMDRRTTFVALGGGVIGDMTGFAAAAYQRGVHFLQARLCLPITVCWRSGIACRPCSGGGLHWVAGFCLCGQCW